MSVRPPPASRPDEEKTPAATREFLALYDEHARLLLAWLATRVSRSDLEDVHQEIWTKVWAKKARSFQGGNFRAWLFTVARNHLHDRREKKPATPLLDDPEAAQIDPRQQPAIGIVIDRERHDRLVAFIDLLPDVRRRVMRARLEGADYESIAAALGITTSQAHSHFFAAKRQLQEWLAEG